MEEVSEIRIEGGLITSDGKEFESFEVLAKKEMEMPPIVWLAMALALLFIAGSAAVTLPGAAHDAVKPVADAMGEAINYVGICIGVTLIIAIILISVIIFVKSKRDGIENHD